MRVQNMSKNNNSKSISYKTNEEKTYYSHYDQNLVDMSEKAISPKKHGGILRIFGGIKNSSSRNCPKVVEMNGTESGVAFFLHFSVHAAKKDQSELEDSRILPVHYSDNYFSLVPGETMSISISFEMPHDITHVSLSVDGIASKIISFVV